uniref:Methyltransferase and helicase domain protein n=1 Tax=Grapevine leafroll-associated virus 4 TaxID=70177 RepID=A0A5A4DN31_9CLOS|nr:methyltransferase and helicase domain protein [Grapevine leafroll-associated virus 4]
MSDRAPSSGYPPSSDPKKTPLPKQLAKGSAWIPSGTYKNPTSLLSGPTANRIVKTEQERSQGPSAKFSNLTAEGKAALKGKGKVDVNKPRQPSNKELAAIFRSTGHVLNYTSKLPVAKPTSRKGSPTSVSPRSSSASSCSYHSSLSSGPIFSLPKVYTSFTDLAEAAKHNVASPPKSPLKHSEDGQKKLFSFGTASLSEAAKVPAPQKSQASASGTKPEVKTAVRPSNTNSRITPVQANVGNSGVQTAKHSSVTPAVNTNLKHSNWGGIKRRSDIPVPNKNEINLQAVRSVADIRKQKIFPSELSLRMQERLCDLLDNLNHNANDVAISYVKSRIVGDSLKAMHHLFLIGNKGKIHFFNPQGYYVGQVVVNEPIWFYGRVAGSNKSMYLSLGDSKTSKCFLKSRFPTLAEFVSNDWAKGKSSLKHVTVFDPVKNRNFRGDRGFCWLPLYTSSDIPISQYPTGGLVRLFALYDKFGPVPIVKSGKYYHYDPKGRKHIKFPNVWVGAEPQNASSEITTWEDCEADPLLRTAVDSVLRRTALKETSNFQNNIDSLFDKALTHSLNSSRMEKLSVSQHLNAEEFELLKGYFGLSYLGNGMAPRSPHSLLNAMRECFNKLYHKAFRGVSVSDIGGNLSAAVFSDCSNTHVCLPLIDMKDAARQTRSAIALFNGVETKCEDANMLAKRLQTLNNITFCHDVVPNCSVKSTAIIMVDVYDLSVSSLVKAMEKKGSLIARCCFMFPPELINRDGVVVHPATNVVVTRNGRILTYSIANTSDSYTHNLDNVLSFITTSSLRSESGLVYSVELLNQNGPYMDFQVALSTNSNTRAGTRCFEAWLKNKSEVTVQRLLDDDQTVNLKLVMDRDFVRRVLSYSANVCNSLDDRTYEYVLSNIRSQTTMMIVGSKIVHNKVDISNDVIVELPGTFLKEAVKRRRRTIEQTKRANAGFFSKLLGSILSIPRKLISSLISFIRKLLPKKLKAKFDELLDEPALIVDCADVVATETSNQAGGRQLKNEVLADVLNAVKELTLLSAPQPVIEEEEEITVEEDEDPIPTSRKQVREEIQEKPKKKGALKGGGGNWYDFILPKKASKKTGSSILAEIWRIIRKLDLACRNSKMMCAIIELFKIIFRALKTVATPLLFNPGNFFTSGKKKESPLEQGASAVKNLFGGFLESLVRFIDLSFFGRLFNVFVETKTCVVENITDWKNNVSDNIINGLKTRIACGLKYMGLKPPKGWLNESSAARLILNKVLSELKGLPLFPLATATLITLLASKTVREKLLGFSNRAICFIESIKVKRPIFICSIILGAVMKNLARLSFLMMPVEDCREVCIGMMFSNILNCAYNTYREPTVLNKVEVLSNFLLLQRNMDIMSSVFALQKRVVDEPTVKDVADVDPKLSHFEINSDVEEVINNFRSNIKDLKNAKLEKRPVKFEVGESSGSKKAETAKPKVATADKRRKESSKRSTGDCGIVINDEHISETRAEATLKEKEKKAEPVVKVSKACNTEEPAAQTEPTRIPTPSYIELDEERNAIFSEENLEATVDEVLSDAEGKKTGDTRMKADISQLSEAEIDLLVENFNSEIFGTEDKEKENTTAKLESISETDSEDSESEHETAFVEEPTCETDTTSDSSEQPIEEVSCEESHLTCSCGIDINVKPFTVPAPLPLIGGDKLNGREAWFYSRNGDPYSYVGGSHNSRGWPNVLNRYIVNTGLNPATFNHCLVQRYATGAGIPYHKDNEAVYPKNNPILTIHVSGEGMFSIRCYSGSGEVLMREPCWFMMPFGFQVSHQHSVTCATVRVSMTFRSTEVIKSLNPVNHGLALVVRDGDGSFGAEHVKKAVKPSSEGKPLSLRPQTSLVMSSTVKSKSCSMLSLCSDSTGVDISDFEDFLKVESYKNMKHYVTNSGNVGAVIEAYLYNLHELHKEVSVLQKALNQPEILVGKKREVYSSSIPDLDRVKVCKNPEMLLSDGINSMYGSITGKELVFSNDKMLRTADSVLYLSPANMSFPLRRCIGIFKMLSILSSADIERGIVGCKFINAVPGAGKTHEIKLLMKCHADNKASKGLMLVLTSSRNAAESLNDYWESDIRDKKVVVMTVDSFIFSGGKFSAKDVESVMIDECYMSHAGLCILIAAITNPSSLSFYGDRRQVPFINRNPTFRDTMSMLKTSAGQYTEKLLSFRCPADICYWMSTVDYLKPGGRLYSGKVTTVKDKRPLKSVSILPFSPNQLDFMKNVDRVMTFTQMEKADLISKFQAAGFGDREKATELIGTVAESQGETYARVALVRTKAADDAVFSSFPHRLVALTRHTVSLQFVCLPTKMSKGIGADCKMIEKLESSVARSFVVQHHV